MFKIFQGFHFVERMQHHKQTRRNEKLPKHLTGLIFSLVVTFVLWNMPIEKFGIPELTVVQQRTIALFAFATLMWLLEVVPSWCTSVAIITTCIFTMSNDAFFTFTEGIAPEKLGTLLSSKEVMATFADPIIMLFLGGFMLAIAATKTGLDVRLARILLKPFGKKSENVLLGFLLITGLFSMFVSNTATAAMMLAFLTPVLKALPDSGKGRIALALAIPIGANIGAIINYYLAYFVGRPIVYKFANSRFGHMCLIDEEKVKHAEAYFDKHGALSTFVGRLIPAVRQLISIPAGLAKMKLSTFLLYTTLGAGIWNAILAAIGYYLQSVVPEDQLMATVTEYSHELGYVFICLGLLIVAYLIYKGRK